MQCDPKQKPISIKRKKFKGSRKRALNIEKPSSDCSTPSFIDELNNALRIGSDPIGSALSYIDEFHGPFQKYSKFLGRIKDNILSVENTLASTFRNIDEAVSTIGALTNQASFLTNKINSIIGNGMDDYQLRQFVIKVFQIHPAVTANIVANIDKYPYFQNISENVGAFVHFTNDDTTSPLIDRCFIPAEGGANILRYTLKNKVYDPIAFNIERSYAFLNSLSLDTLSPFDVASNILDYGTGAALSHGFTGVADFFAKANYLKKSANVVLNNLLNELGDVLRLLNNFLPIVDLLSNDDCPVTPINSLGTPLNPIDSIGRSLITNNLDYYTEPIPANNKILL